MSDFLFSKTYEDINLIGLDKSVVFLMQVFVRSVNVTVSRSL